MGRFGVVGLFLLAVLVVTYAFLRSDGASPALSAEGTSGEAASSSSGSSGGAPVAAKKAAPGKSAEPEEKPEPKSLRAMAREALEKAESAPTREKALEQVDTARRLLSRAMLESPAGKERETLLKEVEESPDCLPGGLTEADHLCELALVGIAPSVLRLVFVLKCDLSEDQVKHRRCGPEDGSPLLEEVGGDGAVELMRADDSVVGRLVSGHNLDALAPLLGSE